MAKKKNKLKIKWDWKRSIAVVIVAAVIIYAAFALSSPPSERIVSEEDGIMIAKDGTKYLVDPSKIIGGGPRKGGIGVSRGIPSLAEQNIKFISVEEADEWIGDDELVLALTYKGEKRVYPLQIMVFHEIVNDRIQGELIIVTFCPLCGSGIAYKGLININGKETESRFGTSGKLYNSNLVMYDEETDSYWTQIDGKAIVGELTGQELEEISVDTVVWRDWKVEYSDSKVLSKETGFSRPYGIDPYGSYYEDSFLLFPVEESDDRVHPKTVVFGIEVDGTYKAYKEEDLKLLREITEKVGNTNIKVTRDKVGIVKIFNQDTGEEIIKERDFWFAWYAFHPDTLLYEAP